MDTSYTKDSGMILVSSMGMRIMVVLFALFLSVGKVCHATDHNGDLLSIVSLSPGTATEASVKAILGKPARIEENKKKTWWHYSKGNTDLVICWNKKESKVEKYSFTNQQVQKPALDNKACHKLKSGATDLLQAMKLLGTPQDMTIKKMTQELHYRYDKSVLRLFFRDRVLVDYTLLTQK